MAKYNRLQVYQAMLINKLVPVFYHPDVLVAKEVLRACYQGGVRIFEFTNRGDFSHEIFSELVTFAHRECPDMILGIGSVVDASTASLYIQCGSDFVVSPLLNTDIFKVCNRRQIPYIPGCVTPTEIGLAQESGAEIVKVFPGGAVGGPAFVKNILAPMPWSTIMVTGGVDITRQSLEQWFAAGVKCVGIGSNLFPEKALAEKEWIIITETCKQVIKIIDSL